MMQFHERPRNPENPRVSRDLEVLEYLRQRPAYRLLHEHQQQAWLHHCLQLPASWLLNEPEDDEVFKDSTECFKRLNVWGLTEGCLFVKLLTPAKSASTPRWVFGCKFHSDRSRNIRQLEDVVERDKDGKIISKRQRNTFHKKRNCPVEYVLSYKLVSRTKGCEERVYQGRWRCKHHENHEHPMNPLILDVHLKSLDTFQHMVGEALKYRTESQPFSEAKKLLRHESTGLLIKPRQYYNLLKSQVLRPGDDSIIAVLACLDDTGFKYRTRTCDEIDDLGKVVKRKLIQTVFWLEEAENDIQRWTSSALLIVDGTFNTNNLKFPLLVAVGKSNTEKIFPVAFSYCPGEDAASFSFFFESLREEIYIEDIPEPAVIMIDQSSGAISAVDTYDALPNSQLQYCNWHAHEAMIAKFRKERYTSKEIDGFYDDEQPGRPFVPGLKGLAWRYLNSEISEELTVNRELLLAHLSEKDKKYIDENWHRKEVRVVSLYTRQYANLGANSSQGVEQFHRLIHKVAHGQMNLESSIKALIGLMRGCHTQAREFEDRSLVDAPIGLNMKAFQYLVGTISISALKKVQEEWVKLMNLNNLGNPRYSRQLREPKDLDDYTDRTVGADLDIPGCDCELRWRWLLPCRHVLQKAFLIGIPIPKTLIHPRWWLRVSVCRDKKWKPYYPQQQQLIISPKRRTIYSDFQEVINVRERLRPEEQSKLDIQIKRTITTLTNIAERHEELQNISISNPTANPIRRWRKKDIQAPRNARALTANEIQEQDRRHRGATLRIEARDAAILTERALAQEQAQDEGIYTPTELEELPDSQTIVVQPRPKIDVESEALRDYDVLEDLSTAPAKLAATNVTYITAAGAVGDKGSTRSGRKRLKTQKYRDAQEAGLLPES